MALGWDEISLSRIEGGGIRVAILLRVALTGDSPTSVIRLWAGAVRDLSLIADNIETEDGAIYVSMGQLIDLPVVSSLINGQAERADFTISFLGSESADIAALASTEASDVRGAQVNLGWFVFDDNWQKLSPVDWRWEGIADSLSVERNGDGVNAVRTLKLSCGSLFIGRRRPAISYFTDNDQKRRSSDDGFFDQIRRYNAQSTKVWPL